MLGLPDTCPSTHAPPPVSASQALWLFSLSSKCKLQFTLSLSHLLLLLPSLVAGCCRAGLATRVETLSCQSLTALGAQPVWVCLSRHAGVSSVTVAVGDVAGLGGCSGSRSREGLRIMPAQGSAGAVWRTEDVQKAARVCPRGHWRAPGDGCCPTQQAPLLCRCWAWSLEGTRGLCLERTRQDGMRVSHAPGCSVAAGPVPALGPPQFPTLAPRTRLV